jgi:uncharacterized membrane protein
MTLFQYVAVFLIGATLYHIELTYRDVEGLN